jgi:hypothetical protein
MASVLLQVVGGGGLLGSVAQVAAAAGTLVLALILVGLVTVAYKHFRGGGIEWPDEKREADDEVARGGSDDEWDYY